MERNGPPANVGLMEGFGGTAPKCACGDRAADTCPGEWEPGCDLGNNAAHVRVHQTTPEERAALDSALGLMRRDDGWISMDGGLSWRHPAPNAEAPLAPNSPTITVQVRS